MKMLLQKIRNRIQRHKRIRAKVKGTADRPRLSFFKSNRNVYAQLIDDSSGRTLVGVSSLKSSASGSIAKAQQLGTEIAKQAKEKGITKVVFDRGGFKYVGSSRVFAESARAGGLIF